MTIEAFDQFWKAYPKRSGSKNKAAARIKFLKIVASGVEAAKIIRGAWEYKKDVGPKEGTEFVAMAVTWLNQRRWEDYEDEQKPTLAPEKSDVLFEKYRQRRIREGWL